MQKCVWYRMENHFTRQKDDNRWICHMISMLFLFIACCRAFNSSNIYFICRVLLRLKAMSFCHHLACVHRPSGVRHTHSHFNLLWNHWTKFSWDSPCVVSFSNCVRQPYSHSKLLSLLKIKIYSIALLLLYHKSKWAQISTE